MVEALDRVGLIRDIADTVAGYSANILDFSLLKRKDNVIQRQVVLETFDQEQFRKIINALSQVRNVLKVSKN